LNIIRNFKKKTEISHKLCVKYFSITKPLLAKNLSIEELLAKGFALKKPKTSIQREIKQIIEHKSTPKILPGKSKDLLTRQEKERKRNYRPDMAFIKIYIPSIFLDKFVLRDHFPIVTYGQIKQWDGKPITTGPGIFLKAIYLPIPKEKMARKVEHRTYYPTKKYENAVLGVNYFPDGSPWNTLWSKKYSVKVGDILIIRPFKKEGDFLVPEDSSTVDDFSQLPDFKPYYFGVKWEYDNKASRLRDKRIQQKKNIRHK